MCKVEVCSSVFETFFPPLIFLTITYVPALELLQLHTAQVTRHHFDALFLIHVFPKSNFILP